MYRSFRESGGGGTVAHCSPDVLFVVIRFEPASNMSVLPACEPSTKLHIKSYAGVQRVVCVDVVFRKSRYHDVKTIAAI